LILIQYADVSNGLPSKLTVFGDHVETLDTFDVIGQKIRKGLLPHYWGKYPVTPPPPPITSRGG